MGTYMAKPGEGESKWYVLDATGKPLGRLAAEAARLLRGKQKPTFTPHVDVGDHVIIINAARVQLTGKKAEKKQYRWHTRYPGGLRSMSYATLLKTRPERAVEKAVWGMLPHNSLGRQAFRKLRVYRGASHPHAAQRPEAWEIKG